MGKEGHLRQKFLQIQRKNNVYLPSDFKIDL